MNPDESTQNAPSTPAPEPSNRPAQMGSTNNTPGEMPTSEKGYGGVIGATIIIIIIVVGGLYLWGRDVNNDLTGAEINSQTDESTESLKQQGDSTEIADIEADLNATSLDGLDQEMQSIDGELNAN